MNRILLFGDIPGVPQLLCHVPDKHVAGIVGAEIRPQYHAELRELAIARNVPFIIQPKWQSSEYPEFKEHIFALKVDLIWVNSYSMIVRDDILGIARLGGINIHGAMLPRNRGCNPIQWAIINGDLQTGVTLHEMTNGIDAGPIIAQRKVPLHFEDTWINVRDRLSAATNDLIAENLDSVLAGKWLSVPQADQDATVGKRRTPADGAFDWSEPVVDIYNKIRALLPPLPSAFYEDAEQQRIEMPRYQTIWQVAAQKFSNIGKKEMRSDHVRLRPLLKQDASVVQEWSTSRDLTELNKAFDPTSDVNHEAWLEHMVTKRIDLLVFVIEDIRTEREIGICQLSNINWYHRGAELKICIGEQSFQGRGCGAEAVRLLVQFGFHELRLHRIYSHLFASHVQGVRALRKCGFVEECLMKDAAFDDGSFVDVLSLAVFEEDHD